MRLSGDTPYEAFQKCVTHAQKLEASILYFEAGGRCGAQGEYYNTSPFVLLPTLFPVLVCQESCQKDVVEVVVQLLQAFDGDPDFKQNPGRDR